jgi:hypothetical protein
MAIIRTDVDMSSIDSRPLYAAARCGWWIGLLAVAVTVGPCAAATRRPLDLRHVRLELPGPPSALVPSDLNGDGRTDLLLVLAYTEVQSIGADRVEDSIQISTVIPALFDRREVRCYLAGPDGTLAPAGAPLPFPQSILALAPGPGGLLALTDQGVAAVSIGAEEEPALHLRPLIDDRPVIAGSGSFFSQLDWAMDLDGDGSADLLLPSLEGLSVYLWRDGGYDSEPVQRLTYPGDSRFAGSRSYPLPAVGDLNGDGRVDLASRWGAFRHIFLGRGDGTFRPAYGDRGACREAATALRIAGATAEEMSQLVFLGDLDGDGRAEAVMQEELEPEKSGMRAEMKQAKRPRQRFRLFRLTEGLELEAEPYVEFEAVGHSFSADLPTASHHQFQDLDADGRLDLITFTLDFSIFQAIKVLATKRIGIGLDFHVWAQQADGSFRSVDGLDLSEKLKLNLKQMSIGRMAQFAGDFDGDGRADFVHFGRGKQITIHRGQPGCRYPAQPDLVLDLEEEPQDLRLVRIRDFDGDGRTDLSITRPLPVERRDVSAPVLLDLYLSGGGQ